MMRGLIIIVLGVCMLFFTVGFSTHTYAQNNGSKTELKFPSRNGSEVMTVNLNDRDEVRWLSIPPKREYIWPLKNFTENEADKLCAAGVNKNTWAVGELSDGRIFCTEKPEVMLEYFMENPEKLEAICVNMFSMKFLMIDGMKLKCRSDGKAKPSEIIPDKVFS